MYTTCTLSSNSQYCEEDSTNDKVMCLRVKQLTDQGASAEVHVINEQGDLVRPRVSGSLISSDNPVATLAVFHHF